MKTVILQVRLTKTQIERLRTLAEGAGFNTVSSYVRFTLFNPTFDMKLNRIIELVEKLQGKLGISDLLLTEG